MAKVLKFERRESTISYEAGVTEAKKLMNEQSGIQWRLGEIASLLEPKYGKATLKRFADEIELALNTVENYRRVWLAYFGEKPGRPGFSYSAAEALASHPHRIKILTQNPKMTNREARRIMQDHDNRDLHDDDEQDDEPDDTSNDSTKSDKEKEEDSYAERLKNAEKLRSGYSIIMGPTEVDSVVLFMHRLRKKDRVALRKEFLALQDRLNFLLKNITDAALSKPMPGENPDTCDT